MMKRELRNITLLRKFDFLNIDESSMTILELLMEQVAIYAIQIEILKHIKCTKNCRDPSTIFLNEF